MDPDFYFSQSWKVNVFYQANNQMSCYQVDIKLQILHHIIIYIYTTSQHRLFIKKILSMMTYFWQNNL